MAQNCMQERLLHQVSHCAYSVYSVDSVKLALKLICRFVGSRQEMYNLEEQYIAGSWTPPFEKPIPALTDSSNKMPTTEPPALSSYSKKPSNTEPPAKKLRQGKDMYNSCTRAPLYKLVCYMYHCRQTGEGKGECY